MSFVELLTRLGGMGRFQVTYVAALAFPLLMLASHNLLQNFTAGIPEHHCRPRPVANDSIGDVPLFVTIPSDDHHRPQRCRRYVEPQWHLLETNGTANGTATGAATEPCHDGWTYRDGVFAHTIISEVRGGRWALGCGGEDTQVSVDPLPMSSFPPPVAVGPGVRVQEAAAGGPVHLHGRDPPGLRLFRGPLRQVCSWPAAVLGGTGRNWE